MTAIGIVMVVAALVILLRAGMLPKGSSASAVLALAAAVLIAGAILLFGGRWG